MAVEAGAGGKRQLCFLLTDIVESTSMWEQDPLAMDAAVARHDTIVRGVVTGAGGHLVRHRGEGDSTFSIFDDAMDAVVAAADLIRELDAERWPGRLSVQIRAGLHVGEAIARDGDWYGPTVNRTARLRGLAEPGEVLVSTAVSDLVRGRLPAGLDLVDRGGHVLRGAARPEWTRALVDERAEAREDARADGVPRLPLPVGLLPQPGDVALCGRDDALEGLRSRWAEVRSGRARTVLVAGGGGMGKSRLVRELAHEAHRDGATVLHVECDVPDGHTLAPVARTVATVLRALPPVEARRLVGDTARALARLDPDIADRLGVTPPTSSADGHEILDSVREVVRGLASAGPLVVVVDDLHLGGAAVAELLRRVHEPDADGPHGVLAIATFRPGDVESESPAAAVIDELTGAAGSERLRMEGLGRDATRELVALFVGARDDAGRASTVLHSATGGSPLLLTAVLRTLRETGGLDSIREPEDLVLPESVAEVVVERMGRLGAHEADLLRVAAVLGREIDLELVGAVAGATERELGEAEDAWGAVGLAVRDAAGRLCLSHALLAQAVAEQVSATRRARWHRRAAEALEDRGRAPEAARHWHLAAGEGNSERLAVCALDAAASALVRADVDETRRWVAIGLAALDEVAGGRTALQALRARLHLTDAEATLSVSIADALDAADRAVSFARAAGDAVTFARSALARCNGYTVLLNAEDPAGMALHEEALAGLGDTSPALRARLLANVANHRARRDRLGISATPVADEAVAIARQSADASALAYALRMWLQVRQGAPDASDRLPAANEMVAAAERTGDRWELMLCLHRRAGVRLELGDRVGYEIDVAEAERHAARVATPVATYEVRFRRVLRAILDGRFDDARRHLGMLSELVPSLPTALDAWATQTLLLEREVGGLAAMVPLIEDAARTNPNLVAYRAALASALVAADRLDAARQMLRDLCRDDCAAIPRDSAWPSLLALLAEVAIAVADDDAIALLRRELDEYSGSVLLGYESICLGAADRFIAMLDAVSGADVDALFERAAALEHRIGSPPLVARTRLWQARSRLERGACIGAVLSLDAAIELATNLGMASLEAEARRLHAEAGERALLALADGREP